VAALDPTSALTLEAWVKPSTVSTSQTVIRKDGQYLLRLTNQTIDAYIWKPGGTYTEVTSANVLATSIWQQVAVTDDGSTVRIYDNGTLVKSQAITGAIPTTTNPLHIASSTGYDFFTGTLDEVAVYGTALTSSQIASHYATGTNGAPGYLSVTTSPGRISLSWGPSAASGVQGYDVYRQNNDGSWPSTPLATVGASTTTYTDTTVSTNTSYSYRVTAINASGQESQPSNLVTIIAGAPCGPLSSYGSLIAGTPTIAGYWRLDELTGSTACDSVGNSSGTYRYPGNYTLGQPGAISGDADTATRFDGVGGYVNVPDVPKLDPASSLTLEAWVNPNSVNGYQELIRKDGQYLLRMNYQQLDAVIYWANGSYSEVTGPADLGAARYQHVAATYDGSRINLYDNGQLVASQPASGTIASTGNPVRLASANGYDYLAGTLDEAAVYGAALTSSDIVNHYAAGSPPSSNPVPTPPIDLIRASYSGSVLLRWGASTDNDLAGYRVYRQNADGTWPTTAIATTGPSTLQYTDTSVTNGVAYSYRVVAFDAAGQVSGASNQVAATPNPPLSSTGGDPVMLAAGDIAGCYPGSGEGATANLIDNQPGIVAPLGDDAYQTGSAEQFANCYDPTWGRFYARSMPVPGEHEYHTPNAAGYFQYWGALGGDPTKGYYSYNVGTWHVVVLNSTCSAVGGCGAGSPQEQWLASDLATNHANCTLALWHEPRFSSDTVHGDDPDMGAFWQDLYAAGADLVLAGSAHDYERFAPQTPGGQLDSASGIREIVVGTGGAGHYGFGTPDANSQVRDGTTFGVLKLTMHGSSYDWQFLPVASATFTDSGTTQCHGATSTSSVTLTAPANSANVSGRVALSATATGAVTTVNFLVNGQLVGTSSTAPYGISWDSRSVPDGPATVTVQGLNSSGSVVATDSHAITVDNTPPSSVASSPVFSSSPSFSVAYTAADPAGGSGLTEVDLYAKAPGDTAYNKVAATVGSAGSGSFTYTATGGDGTYGFYTLASDNAGNTQAAPAGAQTTTILDSTAPSSTASSPATSSSTSFSVAYTASASAAGLAEVDLYAEAPGQTSYSKIATNNSGNNTGTFTYTATAGNGTYSFYTIATDNAGNAEAAPGVADATTALDTTPPQSSASSPTFTTSNSWSVGYTAADGTTGSGLASVELWVKAPGAASYGHVATDSSGSASGSFSYVANAGDGSYALYTIAVDKAGNRESAPASADATTLLDTAGPSAFQMTDPGQYLHATVTLSLSSTPADSGSGLASVSYQERPTGTTSWQSACVATISPWSCSLNTTTLPDGGYDLRAVATDKAGNTTTASNTPLASRTIDNTAPAGKSITTSNVLGGTIGRIEKGDAVTFTYTETMSPGSVLSGWSGASTAVRVQIAKKSNSSVLTVLNQGGSAQLPLANPLALGGNYVPSSGAVFSATMVQNGASISVTLGSLLSGSVNSARVSGGTLSWTPSATATDLAGNHAKTTAASSPGPAF
jgi:Concanavalin A-like lectin/glucanases superfamily/Bacterial Ig domain/Fibronectin type III domain